MLNLAESVEKGLNVDCPRLTQEIQRGKADTKDVSRSEYK